MFLWSGCFVAWIRIMSNYKVNPFTILDCKFIRFFPAFSSAWSSSLLSVMCIEKFFALYFPLRTRSICTVSMAKKVTLVVTLSLVVYNLQNFFILKTQVFSNGAKQCIYTNVPENYGLIQSQIEYTLYSFAPLKHYVFNKWVHNLQIYDGIM